MNENRSLCLNIGFIGYTYDAVEEYMTKNFVECDKQYAQKWTQMKYVTFDGRELS